MIKYPPKKVFSGFLRHCYARLKIGTLLNIILYYIQEIGQQNHSGKCSCVFLPASWLALSLRGCVIMPWKCVMHVSFTSYLLVPWITNTPTQLAISYLACHPVLVAAPAILGFPLHLIPLSKPWVAHVTRLGAVTICSILVNVTCTIAIGPLQWTPLPL